MLGHRMREKIVDGGDGKSDCHQAQGGSDDD
jgi:hypothetical protein